MNKRDEAVARITEECVANKNLIPLEEYLSSICTNDVIAGKILNKKKTLKECYKEMEKEARKKGRAYLTDPEGFSIIREYYGITGEDVKTGISLVKPQADVIDISSLL